MNDLPPGPGLCIPPGFRANDNFIRSRGLIVAVVVPLAEIDGSSSVQPLSEDVDLPCLVTLLSSLCCMS